MRKVQVINKKMNRETNKFESSVDYIASFHQFGSDYEECENNFGNVSVAIVEKEDGTIMMPRADRIVFIEDNVSFRTKSAAPLIEITEIPIINEERAVLLQRSPGKWDFIRNGSFIRELDKFEANFINSTILTTLEKLQ